MLCHRCFCPAHGSVLAALLCLGQLHSSASRTSPKEADREQLVKHDTSFQQNLCLVPRGPQPWPLEISKSLVIEFNEDGAESFTTKPLQPQYLGKSVVVL